MLRPEGLVRCALLLISNCFYLWNSPTRVWSIMKVISSCADNESHRAINLMFCLFILPCAGSDRFQRNKMYTIRSLSQISNMFQRGYFNRLGLQNSNIRWSFKCTFRFIYSARNEGTDRAEFFNASYRFCPRFDSFAILNVNIDQSRADSIVIFLVL